MKNQQPSQERHSFDWEEIRQRLTTFTEIETSTEDMQRIWAQRAAVLAQQATEEETGKRIEVALVQFGNEVYGLPVAYVLDVHPAQRITHVPRTPEWVVGVTNLHGRIVSVVDLCRYFGLPVAEKDKQTSHPSYLVVISEQPQFVTSERPLETALLANDVIGVEMLETSDEKNPGLLHGIPPQYIHCFVKQNHSNELRPVFNLPSLFSDGRFMIQEELS